MGSRTKATFASNGTLTAAEEAADVENGGATVSPTSAVRDRSDSEVSVLPEIIDIDSVFKIVQTGMDLAVLTYIHRNLKTQYSAAVSLIGLGLVLSTLLRLAAVAHYWVDLGLVRAFPNALLGSRFGYTHHENPHKMARQPLNIVATDPLVLHSLADLVQQSFSCYAVFMVLFSTRGDERNLLLIASAFISCTSMLIGVASRLPYGHFVVMIALYVIYSVSYFFYIVSAREKGEVLLLAKWYTAMLRYPWARFLGMFALSFISVGLARNTNQKRGVPKLMFAYACGLAIVDIVAIAVFQLKQDTFFDSDDDVPIQEKRLVEAFILANISSDLFMITHGFVNYRSS